MSTDHTIICKRTSTPRYQRGQVVIRATATDESQSVAFQHYAEDRRFAYVRFGEESPVRVKTESIVSIEDWRSARKEQASFVNFWKAGA